MATRTDIANDRIQQSSSPAECLALARSLSLPVLRAIADLNHLETHGGHETLALRITADRWPGRSPCRSCDAADTGICRTHEALWDGPRVRRI